MSVPEQVTAVLFLTLLTGLSYSSKILLIPGAASSHVILLAAAAKPLQAKGHVVHMVMERGLEVPKGIIDPKVTIKHYSATVQTAYNHLRHNQQMVEAFEFALEDKSSTDIFNHIMKELTRFTECCKSILESNDYIESLRKEEYDFVITDGSFRCLVVVPHRLGVPFAILTNAGAYDQTFFALQGGIIAPTIADLEFKSTVTLIDKVKKVLGLVLLRRATNIDAGLYSPDAPYDTVHDIANKASLFFLDSSVVFDHQVPLSRNVINVGGFTTRPPEELPNGELKDFLDSAQNGFVLVSFGSLIKIYPEYIADLLMETFRLLPYKVVWKFDKQQLRPNRKVAEHILLVDWIPQNDILGHKNIKLFITHGGNKGQHEALYNAVPMLGIPIFGDQIYNTDRVQAKDLGRKINLRTLKVADFITEINEVITNPKYKAAMSKASGIFHDDVMTPQQRLVHWVEHVIKYGDKHLTSYTNNLSWFQILMVDVIFVMLIGLVFILLLIFFITKCIFNIVCRPRKVKQKQI